MTRRELLSAAALCVVLPCAAGLILLFCGVQP